MKKSIAAYAFGALTTIIFLLLLHGCNKEDVSFIATETHAPKKIPLGYETEIPQDVYLSGTKTPGGGEYPYHDTAAVYWKNGVEVPITNGLEDSYAHDIFVFNGDVYTAGYVIGDEEIYGEHLWMAAYWKDDTQILLTDGTFEARATAIFVTKRRNLGPGGIEDHFAQSPPVDVYVAGWCNSDKGREAKYWKNGVETVLSNNKATATDIFVSEMGDVYVAGYEDGVGKYWKNGTEVSLPSCVAAHAIFVWGNDVYVAGRIKSKATEASRVGYWKNGTAVTLQMEGNYSSWVHGIAVSEKGTVHTVGYESIDGVHVARYWRNEVLIPLPIETQHSIATGIAVVGKDVHIAGYGGYSEKGVIPSAKYWKNGVEVSIPNIEPSSTWAYAIFVEE